MSEVSPLQVTENVQHTGHNPSDVFDRNLTVAVLKQVTKCNNVRSLFQEQILVIDALYMAFDAGQEPFHFCLHIW